MNSLIQKSSLRGAALLCIMFCTRMIASAQTGPCATVIPDKNLPDLVIDSARLKSDIVVTEETFDRNSCNVVEGFVSSKGKHQLLRFTTASPNIGLGDLVIGDPNQCTELFHYSECHNHFHYNDYTDYRLWTEQGYATWVELRDLTQPTNSGPNANLLTTLIQNGDLIVGRKMGFCMIDTDQYLLNAPDKKFLLCGGPGAQGNQGITTGWSDRYGQFLDGQFIEIDHLREGIYVLENHVNAEHLLPESNYSNNTAIVRFQFIPAKGKNHPLQVIILP
jgi:Lysyl oxidase